MTTFIPDTPATASSTMNGKPEAIVTETQTIIDFSDATKERAPLLDRLPRRWGLIAGLVGGSIALATTATVVTNVIVRRGAVPKRVFGFRPVRR
jgi:hypothetical protein